MKFQITRAFALFSLVAALSLAISVHAQSVRTIKFDIPFDSTVGRTTLPSGEYNVRIVVTSASKIILLHKTDGSVKVALSTGVPVAQRALNQQAKMIFNRYGDQYFLSQIWEPGDNTGQEFPKSKAERELRNNTQTAQHRAAQETIALMGRH